MTIARRRECLPRSKRTGSHRRGRFAEPESCAKADPTGLPDSQELDLYILSKLTLILLFGLVPTTYAADNSVPVLHGVPGPLEWKNNPLSWTVDESGALSIRRASRRTGSFLRWTASRQRIAEIALQTSR